MNGKSDADGGRPVAGETCSLPKRPDARNRPRGTVPPKGSLRPKGHCDLALLLGRCGQLPGGLPPPREDFRLHGCAHAGRTTTSGRRVSPPAALLGHSHTLGWWKPTRRRLTQSWSSRPSSWSPRARTRRRSWPRRTSRPGSRCTTRHRRRASWRQARGPGCGCRGRR